MSLVSTKNMLLDARKNNYAVPAFNIHNLETIQVVLDTANRMNSPVILAATPGTVDYAGMDYLHAIVREAARHGNIPVALHLDHFTDTEKLKRCIDAGFTSAMIDASQHPFDKNVEITCGIVKYAHSREVTVEAELGRLSGQEDTLAVAEEESEYTDPQQAREFVERTGIDSLAVAIGTAHGMYKKTPHIDFERLGLIRQQVDIPLVLHGASGLSNETVAKALENGICKVNIATELKISFADALKEYFKENPGADDPRKYMLPAKASMEKVVEAKIILCRSHGRAK